MIRTDTAFGASVRAARARKGPQPARVPSAYKLARIAYHLLKYGDPCVEERAAVDEHRRRERDLRQLSRRAMPSRRPPWRLRVRT